MANQDHLVILNQGVDAWNRWREQNSEITPDLSGATLGRVDSENMPLIAMQTLGWLTETRPDLSRVNFSNADLRRASLVHVNLSSADMRGANFRGADLRGATFFEADLTRANLSHSNLRYSELKGANLQGADLMETDLVGAIVDEMNIDGARLGFTIFGGNDISAVKGLETVTHEGPSAISIDTVYESKGNIPEAFMRGAGVPDDFIIYMRSLSIGEQPIRFYSCFISYSQTDKTFARRLHDALQEEGIRCWLDEHQLLPGQKIYDEVDRAIRLSDKVLLCCSKASLTSWWVDNEIDIVLEKEQFLWKERGERALVLIPLNLDGHLFTQQWGSGKASQVRTRLAADFTEWDQSEKKFEEQVKRLVKALQADDQRR